MGHQYYTTYEWVTNTTLHMNGYGIRTEYIYMGIGFQTEEIYKLVRERGEFKTQLLSSESVPNFTNSDPMTDISKDVSAKHTCKHSAEMTAYERNAFMFSKYANGTHLCVKNFKDKIRIVFLLLLVSIITWVTCIPHRDQRNMSSSRDQITLTTMTVLRRAIPYY